MFLWCNSNSLQIIELHADAWSWRRLIADRQTCVCCNSAAHVKLGHCTVIGQDIRLLPTVSTPSLSSYFIFYGVSAYFIGFSAEVGRNVFSKWLEIETEHSVRCTKPSNKHEHSEVFSCPAKSCDVRMLWILCSEVYRSAQCKACCMLVQVLSKPPCVLHTTQVPTQNMYIFSVFRSVLFALIPVCLMFHSTV
jgi:hypothetical protein